MKKILLIIIIVVFTTGCTNIINIKETNLDTIVDNTLNSKYKLINHVNKGFKYYLPRELKISKQDETNEIIKYNDYEYYLYVDLISYYNKTEVNYEKSDAYYSRILDKGIINIYDESDEYYIKVTYNYATIETKVNIIDINENLSNIMIILSSMNYNDDVIKNILVNDSNASKEESIEVFDNNKTDNTYLDVEETEYTGNEEEDYDPDVIN